MTYYVGDTLLLKCSFYSWAGTLADPTSVTLNIYDVSRTKLVTAATPTKLSTGVYYYYYTPSVEGRQTVEFSGTLATNTTLVRKYVTIEWHSA